MLSHITACSASAVFHYGVLDKCCLTLRRARRVLSSVTECSTSAVSHYSVLGECCLPLRSARQVLSSVTECSASAVLRYGVLGECYLVSRCARECYLMLRHAQRVPSHVTACSGVQCCVTACSANVLTRLPSQTTSSRWQVDKEAIGLSRVQQFLIYMYPALIRYL